MIALMHASEWSGVEYTNIRSGQGGMVALTAGMDDSILRVGDRGMLAKILSLSFRLRPRGKLPMTASAMKLLCRLADPSEVHLRWSSCIYIIHIT